MVELHQEGPASAACAAGLFSSCSSSCSFSCSCFYLLLSSCCSCRGWMLLKTCCRGEQMRDRKPSLKCLQEEGGWHSAFSCHNFHCFLLFPSLLLPQLSPGHSAVDAEVDWVGEEDAGVDQHGHGVGQGVVDEVQVHAVEEGYLTAI